MLKIRAYVKCYNGQNNSHKATEEDKDDENFLNLRDKYTLTSS